MVRVGGDDGEFRQWYYMYVYSNDIFVYRHYMYVYSNKMAGGGPLWGARVPWCS